MSTRKIREIPSELPHAKLFLDDLEEITTILTEAVTGQHEDAKISVSYTVRDTEMDTIGDLERVSGSTSDLALKVSTAAQSHFGLAKLRMQFFSAPSLMMSSSLTSEEAWALYGRVKTVFDDRQLRLKNVLFALPGWLKLVLWIVLVWTAPWVIAAYGNRVSIWLAYGIFVVGVAAVAVIPSRVVFVRSHERAKIAAEKRRTYIRDVLFLLLGALATALAERLFIHVAR